MGRSEKSLFCSSRISGVEKLRSKYGLPKLMDGHEFHITIGVEKK